MNGFLFSIVIITTNFFIINLTKGDRVWSYMDPIGAILLSLYLFVSWWQQGSGMFFSFYLTLLNKNDF